MFPTLTERGGCGCSSSDYGSTKGALERVKFFQRQLLTAEDMVTEQDYFREKLRRHNRFLHGWGVVCGLAVNPAPTEEAPWRVQVSGGYALSQYGDEIYVGEPVFLDLARCAAGDQTDPCDPEVYRRAAGALGRQLFVAIKYADCFARPVRAMPPGCGCEETACEYSRIRDSFELCCRAERPADPPIPSICDLLNRRAITPCPPEPSSPWVILAQVILPASTESPLTSQMINNAVRVRLYSTALIQEQLIACCCRPRQVVPARVTAITPANGVLFLDAGPETIKLTFSKDLQANTVNTSTLTVMRAESTQPLAGSIEWFEADRTAVFKPAEAIREGSYTIQARGSGASPILDVDDLALDGNSDGTAGGNFTSGFLVQETPK